MQVQPWSSASAAVRDPSGGPGGRRAHEFHAAGHDGSSPAASGHPLQH